MHRRLACCKKKILFRQDLESFEMEHPVYGWYKVKQGGGEEEVFSENGWGGFGKSQLGA